PPRGRPPPPAPPAPHTNTPGAPAPPPPTAFGAPPAHSAGIKRRTYLISLTPPRLASLSTATMSHRDGQDRNDVTSLRLHSGGPAAFVRPFRHHGVVAPSTRCDRDAL